MRTELRGHTDGDDPPLLRVHLGTVRVDIAPGFDAPTLSCLLGLLTPENASEGTPS